MQVLGERWRSMQGSRGFRDCEWPEPALAGVSGVIVQG
jgi:hypothetical protein